MARRAAAGPVYRAVLKDSVTHPTCVVAGQDRHHAWLYGHATTPMVLRLHPPVVTFLRATLAELHQLSTTLVAEIVPFCRSLARDVKLSYPDCVVIGPESSRGLVACVRPRTSNVVKLVPDLV